MPRDDAQATEPSADGAARILAEDCLRKLAIFNSLPEHSKNAYRLTVSEAIARAVEQERERLDHVSEAHCDR